MDPRLREDDGSNGMPAPCASFLPCTRHFCPVQSFLPRTRHSCVGRNPSPNPRFREDDGNCGDVCKRANAGKRVDKGINLPKTVAFTKNGEMTPYPINTPPIALMNYFGAKSSQATGQAANRLSRPPA